MHSKADLPQFRALPLNAGSVSVPGAIHLVASGGSLAVIHSDTEEREVSSGSSGAFELGVSFGGWWSGSDAGSGDRAGGGTPP